MTSSLLDNLLAHVAITDHKGIITNTNNSWQSFEDKPIQIKRCKKGSNYFSMLQQAIELGNDYALKMLLGMKKVLQGESEQFTLTYPLGYKNTSSWFRFTFQFFDEDLSQFIMIHEDVTSSVQTQKNKEQAKDRYEIQFEQSLDGILITDTKGNVLDTNPAACDILGWSKDKLIRLTRDKIIDTTDPIYQKGLKNREETGTYKLETNLIHSSGKRIPAELTSNAFRNKNGKLRAIVSFRDISKRKEAEYNLLKTKHFTESALNSIPGVFLVLDHQGNIVRWNEYMTKSLGYSSEELAEKNAFEFIIDEEKENMKHKMEECLKKGELSTETKIVSKDGSVKDYFLFAKHFMENGKSYLVGSGIDITEKKKIENENQRTQLMLQQLFDNAPVGIVIADTNNKIVDINKSFQQIFGYDKSEALAKDINKLIAPKQKANEAQEISSLTKEGKSLQLETVRRTKTGTEIPVLVGSVPVKQDGQAIAIYGMYVDISEQVEYQHNIENALDEKETLLAELHHRVKNNLALITSMMELQIFESENSNLEKALTNVKKRILTIASIHEVLYQNGSLSKIPFNSFLEKLVQNQSTKETLDAKNFIVHQNSHHVSLDINQSIPAGLLVNEVLSLIMTHSKNAHKTELDLLIREYDGKVHLIIEGHNLVKCPKEIKEQKSLHHTLIDTLSLQLYGTFLWPNPDTDYQKFEFIFEKRNGMSPAAQLLEVAE